MEEEAFRKRSRVNEIKKLGAYVLMDGKYVT